MAGWEVDIGENLVVGGPAWGRYVYGRRVWAWEKLRQECGSEMHCSSTGDRLERTHLVEFVSEVIDRSPKVSRTRFSLIAGDSAPRTSFCAADVKSGMPAMGRYSWLRLALAW